MQISKVIALAFAAFVSAAPEDVTITLGQDACDNNLESSCCNNVSISGDSIKATEGILSGLFCGALSGTDGLGLFDGCSKLDFTAGILGGVVGDLLISQRKQSVACCQDSPTNQNGDMNVGLPCVSLSSLI